MENIENYISNNYIRIFYIKSIYLKKNNIIDIIIQNLMSNGFILLYRTYNIVIFKDNNNFTNFKKHIMNYIQKNTLINNDDIIIGKYNYFIKPLI